MEVKLLDKECDPYGRTYDIQLNGCSRDLLELIRMLLGNTTWLSPQSESLKQRQHDLLQEAICLREELRDQLNMKNTYMLCFKYCSNGEQPTIRLRMRETDINFVQD